MLQLGREGGALVAGEKGIKRVLIGKVSRGHMLRIFGEKRGRVAGQAFRAGCKEGRVSGGEFKDGEQKRKSYCDRNGGGDILRRKPKKESAIKGAWGETSSNVRASCWSKKPEEKRGSRNFLGKGNKKDSHSRGGEGNCGEGYRRSKKIDGALHGVGFEQCEGEIDRERVGRTLERGKEGKGKKGVGRGG